MGSSTNTFNFGAFDPWTNQNESTRMDFRMQMALRRVQTCTPVRVINVTTDGDMQGFVDVQILMNQLDGNGNAIEHGILNNLPYCRIIGGTNGIIIDPAPGDIGIALFCSRDISVFKATRDTANPGSNRTHDFADGFFVGGFLNAAPVQYVKFTDEGIEIVSPTKITLTAPMVQIDGALNLTGGNTTGTGSITTDGDMTAVGTSLHTHIHNTTAPGEPTTPPL